MKRLRLSSLLLLLAATASVGPAGGSFGNCDFLRAECQLRCSTGIRSFTCNPFRCVCD